MRKSKLIAFLLVFIFCITSVVFADPLKYGDKGAEVTKLQKQLKKLGYFDGSITGYYGDLTKTAVKKFQTKKKISTTGAVGPLTAKALYGSGTSSRSTADKSPDKAAIESLKQVQGALKKMGLYKGKIDGLSGSQTTSAVKEFQKKYKLKATGVIDQNTKSKILSQYAASTSAGRGVSMAASAYTSRVQAVNASKEEVQLQNADIMSVEAEAALESSNAEKTDLQAETEAEMDDSALEEVTEPSEGEEENQGTEENNNEEPIETDGKIEVLDWWTAANKVFAKGSVARVIDVRTGKSFNVKRTYGRNHADCETLTKKDTEIMKEIWGGDFSWSRRPVIVEINGRLLAASMAGMPHAGLDNKPANVTVSNRSLGYGRGANLDAVKKNNMDGHFDIHFKNSRTHGTNRVDAAHQRAIREAAAAKL